MGSCHIRGHKQGEHVKKRWKLQSVQPPTLPSRSTQASASLVVLVEFGRPFGGITHRLSPDSNSPKQRFGEDKMKRWPYSESRRHDPPPCLPVLLSLRL